MQKNTVTLSDIAQKTGFSINTVSHALHDKPDISQKTKEIIRAAAEQMGYIVNASASYLRSGVSKNIALILGDISNPHFSVMAKEIECLVRAEGYTAFMLNTDEDEELERQAIMMSLSKSVDGILICPVQKSRKNISFLQSAGVPFVLLGRWDNEINTDYVVCDDENSGYLAAKHLLSLGHREILFLTAPDYVSSARERAEGICRAFREENMAFPQENRYALHFGTAEHTAELTDILQKRIDATAIICFSDMIADEVVYLLRERGISVPKQVSVIGFDNIRARFFGSYPLTTVTPERTDFAEKAVDILLQEIRAEQVLPKQHICFPTHLIVRESTDICPLKNK